MEKLVENTGLYSPSYEHDACGVGFVAHIKGLKSHEIVRRGLEVLINLEHRGASGADEATGDGAGITIQIPHEFFNKVCPGLPEYGLYGTGLVFLPRDPALQLLCIGKITEIVQGEKLEILCWREVPVNNATIGAGARATEPFISQIFIKKDPLRGREAFERKLYLIRRRIEKWNRENCPDTNIPVYIPSLSSYIFIYKGMLHAHQLTEYFLDLNDADLTSALALVHSRFSTNTFPRWDLAQPFRMIAHNGEINTLKGNVFWMQARESLLRTDLFDEDLDALLPVIEPNGSDSSTFDNVLEFLVMTGRKIPQSMMIMIPESWNDKNPIADDRKAFYEYYSTLMEPWDGPATMAFTDGRVIGATLDRNGLRPARYIVTKDNMIVLGSEVGVQTFVPDRVKYKGRLMPGKMLLVNLEEGRIISDDEVKGDVVSRHPYRRWVEENRINLSDLKLHGDLPAPLTPARLIELQQVFGYTREDLEVVIKPMAEEGKEPTSSMGTDTPLAILSSKPQRLFNYFKQTFAQVTNPPIDPIREELVMSLTSYIGTKRNLLEKSPEHCRMIKYRSPILTYAEVEKIRSNPDSGFKSVTLDILFNPEQGIEAALEEIFSLSAAYIRRGVDFIFLSDEKADATHVPIPALLATAAIHHHLVRTKTRSQVGLIIITGDAREVMHCALLFGYGADAICPCLAYQSIQTLIDENNCECRDYQKAEAQYIDAINKGVLKILSKMGISTIRSYRGSQLFEVLGLNQTVVDKYFTGTISRIGGLDIAGITKEVLQLHQDFYQKRISSKLLPSAGQYQYRKDGEHHAWNPETISLLQQAVRSNDFKIYQQFANLSNRQNTESGVIRGILEFKPTQAIPLSEVESADKIVRRFTSGAMSFGSISKEAHEAMAIAMNKLHGRSNTGEGGEAPERFQPLPDGTSKRSAIKQIASGRFGVTTHYLVNADELQIKIAQGAKPGEGGQLPGHKVDAIIAKTRHSMPGVTLISPPPHHDIYSIEDLAQLIFDLKNVNPRAAISVKLVSEAGVGTVAAGVAKAHADLIIISGYDGGTGASPTSSIRHAGVPWELGLAETQQTLILNNLRGRVKLQTDGQLKTGMDVILAALLGADEFGFATSALISLGCIMMRKCHKNSCPVGIATQDPELRRRFCGKPEHLVNYLLFVAEEARLIMASLGVNSIAELIGRVDLLKLRTNDPRWKLQTLDLSKIIYQPEIALQEHRPLRQVQEQSHKIQNILDRKLIKIAEQAILSKENVVGRFLIQNVNRSVGAMLSGQIAAKYGESALPADTIRFTFDGSAGQSFGAFLVNGVTFRLEGDANDYVGKGLSGGKIIIVPPCGSAFTASDSVIIGNTTFYGATTGEAYINGVAGERFCIRNSGAKAVVEGVGDHACEYMTGGYVVVLGAVGRNFGAGMSGGIAYVYDVVGNFDYFCNKDMVELLPVENKRDEQTLKTLITNHYTHTGSTRAKELLDNWATALKRFVKVYPLEYKKLLAAHPELEIAEESDG